MGEKAIEAYAVAVAAFQKGDIPKAIKYWKKVVNNKVIDEKVKGKAYLGLGFCYSRKEKFNDALNAHKSALVIFQKLKDKKAQAECLGVMGGLYFRNNFIKEALTAYESGLYLAKQIKNREMEADILGDIGSVFDFMDKYDEAVDVFTRSLKLYRKIGKYKSKRGEARALYDLGLALYHARKLGEARSNLEKALRLMKKNNDRKGEANCHATLGDIYLENGEFDIAEKYYNRALRYFQAHKAVYGLINIQLGLAKILLRKEKLTAAKDKFEYALELASKTKFSKLMASALLYLSEIHKELGNTKEAENYKATAQKTLKAIGIEIENKT